MVYSSGQSSYESWLLQELTFTSMSPGTVPAPRIKSTGLIEDYPRPATIIGIFFSQFLAQTLEITVGAGIGIHDIAHACVGGASVLCWGMTAQRVTASCSEAGGVACSSCASFVVVRAIDARFAGRCSLVVSLGHTVVYIWLFSSCLLE